MIVKFSGSWRELEKYPFKKLMVVRVLRPDRITAALTGFIKENLPKGKDFVECDSELNSFQILEQVRSSQRGRYTYYISDAVVMYGRHLRTRLR